MHLHVLTALARARHAEAVLDGILQGRIQQAVVHIESVLCEGKAQPQGNGWAELAQLCGDLLLALDRSAEAEEWYERAVRLARQGSRGCVRIASCRSAGFLNLHQQRFSTAISCFSRMAEDEVATPEHRVEALCALAQARYGLGQPEAAQQALAHAHECARAAESADLIMLVDLMHAGLTTQLAIRTHHSLRDHVFWQIVAGHEGEVGVAQALQAVDRCARLYGAHELADRHLQHLRRLLLVSGGEARLLEELQSDLAWFRRVGLSAAERQARLGVALVAVACRATDFARAVLEPLQDPGREWLRQRWNVDLWYCHAKICAISGRAEESMRHYQRYALESMQCVRAEAAGVGPTRQPSAGRPASAAKDDVEMRLPAKYRRAYRYLLEHLDRPALSVREISEHMGVTERALQSVFKSHLGMTPGEVMQRCRVERIHADLLDERAGASASVIETATRWGIPNRSTLVASYRKYFHETPAQTLQRCGADDAPFALRPLAYG
jgi:AraC-like DNA-binding protein